LRRKRKKRRLNLKALATFVLILVLAICAGYAGTKYLLAVVFPEPSYQDSEDQELPAERLHLVLLGLDAIDPAEMSRADSVLFVSADPKEQRVAILSIPRDTWVNIPGHGWDKINATTVYGGPELTCQVVSGLLGLPVEHYVMVGYDGFRELVDLLGGVTLEVEQRMYYRDLRATPPLVIDLQPGEQRLDGDKALQYVRYRCDGLGDITRTQRQQKFLAALANEMMKPGNIVKLPKLVPELNDCVATNLALRDMLRWAGVARKLDGVEVVSATLPGNFLDYNGLSYWSVDPARAKEVAVKLINGEEIGDPVDERVAPVQGVAYQPAPPPANTPPAADLDRPQTPPAGQGESDRDQGGGEGGDIPGSEAEAPRSEPTEPPGQSAEQRDPLDVADWPRWTGYPEGFGQGPE